MSIDFDALVTQARFGQSKTGEHDLWKAALALDHWYFLGQGEGDEVEPVFAKHDGQTHLLAFTDEDRANAMAEQTEQITGRRPSILHMDVPDAIDYFRVLDQDGAVAGVHFNNGQFAFAESLVHVVDMSTRYRG